MTPDERMASPVPVAEACIGRPKPPPLRIHHFLACGVVAALLFTLWRSQMRPESWKLVDAATAATLALFAMNQIIQAAAITLAAFSVYWHMTGYAALQQPGPWLAIATSFSTLESAARPLIGPIVVRTPWEKNIFLWDGSDLLFAVVHYAVMFTYWILPVLLFGWLAWRIADTLPWRVLFALKAMRPAGVLLLGLLIRYYGWSSIATITLVATIASVGALGCAVWAAAEDYRRCTWRTWSHWIGVGLFLAQNIVRAISYLKLL